MFDYIKRNPFLFILILIAITAPNLVLGMTKVALYIFLGIIFFIVLLSLLFRLYVWRLQRRAQDGMGGGSAGSNGGFNYTSSWSSRGNQSGNQGGSKGSSSEGVKIVVDQTQEKKVSKNVGEYVDFEEVDK